MAKREYRQIVQPVSRVPEKIFGWLGWIALLFVSALIVYGSYTIGNNEFFQQQLIEEMNNVATSQGVNPEEASTLILDTMQNVWFLSLFAIIPLLMSLIALLRMKNRILSGILFIITALIIAPVGITLLSSLLFIIVAIMLFVRKDKVITEDVYYDSKEQIVEDDLNDSYVSSQETDQSFKENEFEDDDDLEATRVFGAIDENLASQEIDYPVTEEEYEEQAGYAADDDTYDARLARRNNIEKRNRNK